MTSAELKAIEERWTLPSAREWAHVTKCKLCGDILHEHEELSCIRCDAKLLEIASAEVLGLLAEVKRQRDLSAATVNRLEAAELSALAELDEARAEVTRLREHRDEARRLVRDCECCPDTVAGWDAEVEDERKVIDGVMHERCNKHGTWFASSCPSCDEDEILAAEEAAERSEGR